MYSSTLISENYWNIFRIIKWQNKSSDTFSTGMTEIYGWVAVDFAFFLCIPVHGYWELSKRSFLGRMSRFAVILRVLIWQAVILLRFLQRTASRIRSWTNRNISQWSTVILSPHDVSKNWRHAQSRRVNECLCIVGKLRVISIRKDELDRNILGGKSISSQIWGAMWVSTSEKPRVFVTKLL